MKLKLLDLYSDYLLLSFSQASATGLSNLTDGSISHDSVSRFLNGKDYSSKDLWLSTKPMIREYECEDACLIFDDTIVAKPYTDENELIAWHYDHALGHTVKGINILTAFYHSTQNGQSIELPFMFELIQKTCMFSVIKTKELKRKSWVTKNELLESMFKQALHNQLKFKYVLADSWFSSNANMRLIDEKNKTFIFDIKSNRSVVVSQKERNLGQWQKLNELAIPENTPTKVWLKDLEFPVLLIKQVFTNKNNLKGVRILVSNDLDLTKDQFETIYKKRWSVEVYHKSLKQNTAIAKSPTRILRTQSNHIFASMFAYVKLEKIRLSKSLNHFAIKSKIYLAAIKSAYKELNILQDRYACA